MFDLFNKSTIYKVIVFTHSIHTRSHFSKLEYVTNNVCIYHIKNKNKLMQHKYIIEKQKIIIKNKTQELIINAYVFSLELRFIYACTHPSINSYPPTYQ